jgi:hypothetical protein
MKLRAACSKLSLAVLVSIACGARGQNNNAPTLHEVLQRLQANLERYDKRVPSLFCAEHVVSAIDPAPRGQSTVTDSVFRLKRETDSDGTTALTEERDIKSVNGKAAASQEMQGPSLVSGAFEGALAVVSIKQAACMHYSLQRTKKGDAAASFVIRFNTALTRENSADCLLQEKSSGHAVIDPTSMQIMRMELTTPRHVIIPGGAFDAAVIGKRDLTIDYEPVELGGEMFWMPATISMHSVSGDGTFHRTAWSYEAKYSNYHRLQASSHIIPKPE